MNYPDLLNGLFEFWGSLALWYNVRQLYLDKQVRGVTWSSTGFFMLWGYWNLYYYPHLNQWASFFGGCSIVLANTVWFILMIHYGRGASGYSTTIKPSGQGVGGGRTRTPSQANKVIRAKSSRT